MTFDAVDRVFGHPWRNAARGRARCRVSVVPRCSLPFATARQHRVRIELWRNAFGCSQ